MRTILSTLPLALTVICGCAAALRVSSRRLMPARPDSPIITSFSRVSTKYALPGPDEALTDWPKVRPMLPSRRSIGVPSWVPLVK